MEDARKMRGLAAKELVIDEVKLLSPGMERELQERTDAILKATAEPIEPSKYKEPVVYYEPAEGTGGLPAAVCTCGWKKHHVRFKVLEKAAYRHFVKTGHNTARQG